MSPINRVFVVAMSVALLYFSGELLTRAFALPVGVLRAGAALVPFIFAPALPLRLLIPGLSLTVYLIAACLGWGCSRNHCHILEHHASGMMAHFDVVSQRASTTTAFVPE